MTHWVLASVECSCVPSVSRATLTIVVSRIDITAPSIATPEMIQTWRGILCGSSATELCVATESVSVLDIESDGTK
jgi:hypothetical protein